MSSERWRQVEEMIHGALEIAPSQRGAWLERACDGDASLRTEVENLLSCETPTRDFLETPALALKAEWLAEDVALKDSLVVGQHIGRYRIECELGRGGMGAVYLARRADDEYRKFVAIKVVRRGMNSDDIVRRFRNERQILASLDHPNIARLLDGGTTEDGLPFLVMEYVEGTPITDYCDQHRLTTNERLQLFRTVCASVQHAHQNLVVHRDLKPSNIFITPDGTPKLLDFGIAKVLNPELSALSMERTRTELRVLTPDYASPEQVRGEKLMTTSDVYSLGIVLYELLTGHRPYRAAGVLPHERARIICEREPTKPSTAVIHVEVFAHGDFEQQTTITPESVSRSRSTQPDKLRRSLSGDLDNIILMALRKEPQRRYESAAQFSADIGRHLDGLPVIARKDTFAYRSAKFIKRHQVGVATALLIVLATIAGLTTTIWQNMVARAERAKAERRFNDVRKLANSNLFELHDAIANLPGSTPARELLVKRALEYLDSLSQESNGDPELQRDLISAYLKVGNVLGNPNNANLGDTAGALQSYRKALAIAERLTAVNSADAQAYRFLGVISEKMSDVQAGTGDVPGAVESARRSLAISRAIAETTPTNPEARQYLAISHIKLGDVLGNSNFPNLGDQAGAMQNYRLSSEILEYLNGTDSANPKTHRLLGLIYERIGTMLELDGKVDEALNTYRQSLAIRDLLATAYPTNTDAVRDAAVAHEKIGNIMTAKGELTEALESRRKSLEIFQSLVHADPQNVQARQSLAISYIHFGDVLGNPQAPNLGRQAEALKNYQLALEILHATNGADAKDNVKNREIRELIHKRTGAK